MIKIAVCDGKKESAEETERLLGTVCAKRGLLAYIEFFASGSSLLDSIRRGNKYDIIYLDSELPHMKGIELAKQLRKEDKEVILIFSAQKENWKCAKEAAFDYIDYAVLLLDVEAFRFIKRPINKKEFSDIFEKAYQRILSKNSFFTYFYNRNPYKVQLKSILYFESRGRIICIITKHSKGEFYGKLNDVEEKLKNEKLPFLRIHKSFLVNMYQVEKIGTDKVILKNGQELNVSKKRQKIIHEQLLHMDEHF